MVDSDDSNSCGVLHDRGSSQSYHRRRRGLPLIAYLDQYDDHTHILLLFVIFILP
jgi:hypothetical protein